MPMLILGIISFLVNIFAAFTVAVAWIGPALYDIALLILIIVYILMYAKLRYAGPGGS